jgi:NADH-quinone oxidoreductase subunit E
MLTQEEQDDIRVELAKYERKRAAAPDALKIIQRHRGWISDESLKDLADFMDMTVDELDSIATCYSLIFRKPVGRHVILVCDSAICWIMGYDNVRSHLKRQLGIEPGQTTADGRFTVLPTCCIGVCDEAPAMIVDGELHVKLDESKISRILESCT